MERLVIWVPPGPFWVREMGEKKRNSVWLKRWKQFFNIFWFSLKVPNFLLKALWLLLKQHHFLPRAMLSFIFSFRTTAYLMVSVNRTVRISSPISQLPSHTKRKSETKQEKHNLISLPFNHSHSVCVPVVCIMEHCLAFSQRKLTIICFAKRPAIYSF